MYAMKTAWGLSLGVILALTACGPNETGQDEIGTVTEALAPEGSNASLASVTNLPSSLYPGERRFITVAMQNTGVSSPANDWTSLYGLFSPDVQWHWVTTPVTSTTPVGGTASFRMLVTAPPNGGIPFKAQMGVDKVGRFGELVVVAPTIDSSVTPQWGCTLVPESSTVPTSLAPSEARGLTITLKNTGSATWPATGVKLVSEDRPENFWHQTVVDLTTAVPPGGTASFWVPIKAPSTPGTYTFERELRDYNGIVDFRLWGHCVSASIAVGGPSPLAATLASQNFPTTMAPSETRTVTVRMNNTGTKDWTADGNFMLYSLNSPVNLWGITQKPLTVATPSGSAADFTFNVIAPSASGSYTQRWQMRKIGGTDADSFGEIVAIPVTVSTSVTPQYGAQVVSQMIPSSMSAGQPYTFSITMKNTGSTTWSGGTEFLNSTNTPANLWGTTIVPLATGETVAPGASRTFTIAVTAPSTPGSYASSWQMRSSNLGRFGQIANQAIVVASATCVSHTTPAGTYKLRVHTENFTEICDFSVGCNVSTTQSDGDGTVTVQLPDDAVSLIRVTIKIPSLFVNETMYVISSALDGLDTAGGWPPEAVAAYPQSTTLHLAWGVEDFFSGNTGYMDIDTQTGAVTQFSRRTNFYGISLHQFITSTGSGSIQCAGQ